MTVLNIALPDKAVVGSDLREDFSVSRWDKLDRTVNSKYSFPHCFFNKRKYWQKGQAWNKPAKQRYFKPSKNSPRKASYIISALSSQLFMEQGAQCLIPNCLYILPRVYNGTATGETNAVIGINKRFIGCILNKDSFIYAKLKTCVYLRDVLGIENLSPYRLFEAYKFISRYLFCINDNELLLFNIEPRGNFGRFRYKSANVSLTGGGMEPRDNFCWQTCAKREFQEEVGLRLDDEESEGLKLITKQKYDHFDKQVMYFIYRIYKFKEDKNTKYKNKTTSPYPFAPIA